MATKHHSLALLQNCVHTNNNQSQILLILSNYLQIQKETVLSQITIPPPQRDSSILTKQRQIMKMIAPLPLSRQININNMISPRQKTNKPGQHKDGPLQPRTRIDKCQRPDYYKSSADKQ